MRPRSRTLNKHTFTDARERLKNAERWRTTPWATTLRSGLDAGRLVFWLNRRLIEPMLILVTSIDSIYL
jgi:hypothetical protein